MANDAIEIISYECNSYIKMILNTGSKIQNVPLFHCTGMTTDSKGYYLFLTNLGSFLKFKL